MQILVFDRRSDSLVHTYKDPYSFYEASTHYIIADGDDTMMCIETVIPKTDYYCMFAD